VRFSRNRVHFSTLIIYQLHMITIIVYSILINHILGSFSVYFFSLSVKFCYTRVCNFQTFIILLRPAKIFTFSITFGTLLIIISIAYIHLSNNFVRIIIIFFQLQLLEFELFIKFIIVFLKMFG
jgi:hypothetical protein